jgi:hypothetical protein
MINFLEVEQLVQTLKKQLAAGEIDQATFEARLMEMVDVAEDGYYWMFGHKTETWYRHDGRQWVADNPGELIASFPHHSNNTHHHGEVANEPEPTWDSLEWGWFLVSLVVIGIIAWFVYASV